MVNFTILFTDRPNPFNDGKPIAGFAGVRSDRRDYVYILETSPTFRWRRYPRFTIQGELRSISNFAGVGTDIQRAVEQLKIGNSLPYKGHEQGFLRYQITLYNRANTLIRYLEEQTHLIPPMFDPDVETD